MGGVRYYDKFCADIGYCPRNKYSPWCPISDWSSTQISAPEPTNQRLQKLWSSPGIACLSSVSKCEKKSANRAAFLYPDMLAVRGKGCATPLSTICSGTGRFIKEKPPTRVATVWNSFFFLRQWDVIYSYRLSVNILSTGRYFLYWRTVWFASICFIQSMENLISCLVIRIDSGDKILIKIEQPKKLFWLKWEIAT